MTEWSKVITEWSASWIGIGLTLVGVIVLIWLTKSSEMRLWEAPQSSKSVKELAKHLKGKWSTFDEAFVLIHPIAGGNVSATRAPTISFLAQSMMEVDPTVALLEAGAYTMVVVLDAVAVRTHANNQRYWDCYCGPSVGLMGLKDLIVTLALDNSTAVVVVVDTRAMEVLKTDFFLL